MFSVLRCTELSDRSCRVHGLAGGRLDVYFGGIMN